MGQPAEEVLHNLPVHAQTSLYFTPRYTPGPDGPRGVWRHGYDVCGLKNMRNLTDIPGFGANTYRLEAEQDLMQRIKMPFKFPFFEKTYDEVYIGAKGYMNFGGLDKQIFPSLERHREPPQPTAKERAGRREKMCVSDAI